MHIDIWFFWLIITMVLAIGYSVGYIICGAFIESEKEYIQKIEYALLDAEKKLGQTAK